MFNESVSPPFFDKMAYSLTPLSPLPTLLPPPPPQTPGVPRGVTCTKLNSLPQISQGETIEVSQNCLLGQHIRLSLNKKTGKLSYGLSSFSLPQLFTSMPFGGNFGKDKRFKRTNWLCQCGEAREKEEHLRGRSALCIRACQF